MPFSQGTASTPARWHRWWTMTGLSPPGSSPATRPIPSGRPDDRISKSMSSAAGWDPDLSLRAPASPSEILPRRIRRGWDPMKEGGSAIAAVRGAGTGVQGFNEELFDRSFCDGLGDGMGVGTPGLAVGLIAETRGEKGDRGKRGTRGNRGTGG